MDIRDLIVYWGIIRKRLWLVALLVGVTLVTVIAVSAMKPALYRTSLRFQVTAAPPADVSLYEAFRASAYRDEIAITRANFIAVLTSLEVAWQAVNELNLDLLGNELVTMISVEESSDSDFVRLIVTSEDPQLSADIANTLITLAVRRYGELNARPITTTREFIQSQLEQQRLELEQAQAELITFKAENNFGTLESSLSAQQELIRSLELSHDRAIAEGDLTLAQKYNLLINQRQGDLQQLILLSGEYSVIETRVRQLQNTYNFLLEKHTEAQLKENEALNLGFVQVLGPAIIPHTPEGWLNLSIVALSLVVALTVGVMLAFLLEYIERLHSPEIAPKPASPISQQADAV